MEFLTIIDSYSVSGSLYGPVAVLHHLQLFYLIIYIP